MTRSASATFPPEPATARAARRFVSQSLREWGLEDESAETALLLVSELVTNAVLHAGTELVVRLAAGAGALRVEVEDGSTVDPSRRHYTPEAVTGRGLGLVEALSERWGVAPSGAGKGVWFELPSEEPGESPVRAAAGAPPEREVAGLVVQLVGLPVPLIWAAVQYGDALLREVTLLALDGDADVGGFEHWQSPPLDLEPLLAPVRQALDAGVDTSDVTAALPSGAGNSALRRLALIEEANRLAAEGHLLLPAGLPEVNAARAWMLGEIMRQEEGKEPAAWAMPVSSRTAAPLVVPMEQEQALEAMPGAVLAADDTNHIVYVSAEAAALLGWDADDLRGERLTVIVPPALRAAHLGGYTRYQVTGERRLLGDTVRVAALRRDGTTVDVQLLIDVLFEHPYRLFFARMNAVVS